jgi:hypothetical protein
MKKNKNVKKNYTFKEAAYIILQKGPAHSQEIYELAKNKGLIGSSGLTPAATMNAVLVVDVNKLGEKSFFRKKGPSTFDLNPKYKGIDITELRAMGKFKEKIKDPNDISSKQKGSIAEARIAEIISLYGKKTWCCYKPITDEEGIDLIVKERKKSKAATAYLQVKSNFRKDPGVYTATVKIKSISNAPAASAIIFCFFDMNKADMWEHLWFVPVSDFIKKAPRLKSGYYSFVSGFKKRDANTWSQYMTDKYSLSDKIEELFARNQ